MRTFALCLLVATAAAADPSVAVLPLAPRERVLSVAAAAALTEEIRAAARSALAADGFTVTDKGDTPAAALEAGASAARSGRAASAEGATVLAIGVYKAGSAAPSAVARIMGIGVEQLRADVRKKIPKLVTTALGLAPPASEPAPVPGTLRMPAAVPQPRAASEPPPAAPSPAPAAAPAPEAAKPEAPPANEAPLVTLIREVTSEAESLPGLLRKQNLKILLLDDKPLAAAVRERALKDLTPSMVAAERARWSAFALAPAGADPVKILLSVLDEQVAGFYDPFTKQLVVRNQPPASAGDMGRDGLRVILAHEIEHALQDQNFGIPDLKTLPDDDVRLARTALFEGDAMAVMAAYGARRARKPGRAAFLGAAAILRSVGAESPPNRRGIAPC